MLRRPFREAGALTDMRCAGLICLSQVAAAAGYLREAAAARRVGGPAEEASHAPVKE
jgi:hypothetical protein